MDLKTHAWLALVSISLVTASDSYSTKPASHKIKQRLSPKLVFVSSGSTPKIPPTPTPKSSPATPKTPPATISTPKPTTPSMGTCPRDALKLGLCANFLGGLAGAAKGTPNTPCCSLLQGLADLDAAVCLCTAIKASLLGNDLDVPISLSVLLSACNYKVLSGYKCAD